MTAASHNRIVKQLLDPSYPWVTPQNFFDAVREAEPGASELEITRAGIEALEFMVERAEELATAFRLKDSHNTAFDPRPGDLRAKLAGIWLSCEPYSPDSPAQFIRGRFGLNEQQVNEAFDVADRMLSAPR